jgi:hypothetical protein
MDEAGRRDEDVVSDAILTVRRRWRSAAILRALSRGALFASAILALAAAVDRWARPADLTLVLVIGSAALAALITIGCQIWPIRRTPARRQVARLIEERCPELEDSVSTATAVLDTRGGAFRQLLLADAARRVRTLDLDRIVSQRSLGRARGQAVLTVLLLLAATALVVRPGYRASQTLAMYLFPEHVTIEVTPGDVKVVSGASLQITARLAGGTRVAAAMLSLGAGGTWRTVPMRSTTGGFHVDFESVTGDFQYRVRAGNAESREFNVRVLELPRVAGIDIEYTYPDYTGLEPRVEEDGGDLYAPAGTSVRLRVRTTKPVTSATMVMLDGTRLPLEAQGPDVAAATFRLTDDGSYRVALADHDGLQNPGETEYFIRTMDDRPPDVRILKPASDRKVTPLEEVPIEARAEDDYGLDRFELVYAVRGGAEHAVPLVRSGPATSITGVRTLYMEDLKVQPGDFVTYYARARDLGRGKRSVEARSDIFFLEVKPFGEEFTAAESQAAMGAGAAEGLEALIAAQKEIIIGTWKLDRRSNAGHSEQDMKSLARAQGDLRTKTEQMSRPQGGALVPVFRRRDGAPAPPPENPVQAAAEAMRRAESELDKSQTRAALPNEMEALNQLLKAQAEIRRRQVQRQQASAGGGNGRSGEDLSSLFDRELQRQQETNYETPTPPRGTQQQEPENEALVRVRDLARRQDELSRRQGELAKQQAEMSPEELKRQLERLTREQSELRRLAEELSQRFATENSPTGNGGKDGQKTGKGGQNGDTMREASEEMRSAASELRREDPGRASARSARALDKLRELERQLLGKSGAGQRAVAELQLEAQQLAESQQRVAQEARRLEQRTSGASDAERRLMDQKDSLARRTEQLEAALKSLSGGDASKPRPGASTDNETGEAGGARQADVPNDGGSGQDGAVAQAAREMHRTQLSRRMRESAAALRKRSGRPGGQDEKATAGGEDSLARDLAKVAERLGGASGGEKGDSGKLSEQLAAARQVRDRLKELERRMAEAARKEGDQNGGAKGERAQQNGEQGRQSGTGKEMAATETKDGNGQPGQNGDKPGKSRELERLRAEYDRELRAAEDLLKRLGAESSGLGTTPEQHEYSISSLGTETWKQDHSNWDELRRDVHLALERYESSLSAQLLERETKDRLNAGGDESMPDEYREMVAEYYQSLAKKKP